MADRPRDGMEHRVSTAPWIRRQECVSAQRYTLSKFEVRPTVRPYVLAVWKILKYKHEKSATDYAISKRMAESKTYIYPQLLKNPFKLHEYSTRPLRRGYTSLREHFYTTTTDLLSAFGGLRLFRLTSTHAPRPRRAPPSRLRED